MAVNLYRKFRISVSEDSKRIQGLRVGDIVLRQYKDNEDLSIYTLMCVLKTGFDVIPSVENGERVDKNRHWFVGALLAGNAPTADELLDFVRITNLWDANRLGALYLTADDDNSPYMDVIDGIPIEHSLCYPTGINDTDFEDDFSQYHVVGKDLVDSVYERAGDDNYRICTITRNGVHTSGGFIGLSQLIEQPLGNPDTLLISYKIRSSRPMRSMVATVGYEDGTRTDGTVTVQSTQEWDYKLHVISIDNADRYRRKFTLDFGDMAEGDRVEIADFNIVKLASVSNFGEGMKVRVGRLDGIVDPVFGRLEDYGAYIKRLYASHQVNIAGTLTAGDENGCGSTFYAGRIHKNVLVNSIACDFDTPTETDTAQDHPTGIGEVYKLESEAIINVQTNAWLLGKLHQKYCFSCWLRSNTESDVLISQNGFIIQTVHVPGGNVWQRFNVSFNIREPYTKDECLKISLQPSTGTLQFTSPQLEKGSSATQYQPTDDVLNYTEDFGAWFNKGGIGGTIQNPLLRFGEDGSISSRGNNFVINNDGTGKMAGGRFEWTKDSIIFRDIQIKWEDFDPDTQEQLKPKSIKIVGPTSFIVERGEYTPKSITLTLHDTNFISTSSNRAWYYVGPEGNDIRFDGANGRQLTIFPDAAYWNDEPTLVIKCVVKVNSAEYVDTITIQRVENGEDTYSVQITTSHGNTFKNGIGETTLTAHVYKGGEEITDQMTPHDFDWLRVSGLPDADVSFNERHVGFGNVLKITADEVFQRAQFDCKVRIN